MIQSFQVTIGASATAIAPGDDRRWEWFLLLNAAAHSMTAGTATLQSIPLATSGGFNYQGYIGPLHSSLKGWYVNGTNGDKLDVYGDDGQP